MDHRPYRICANLVILSKESFLLLKSAFSAQNPCFAKFSSKKAKKTNFAVYIWGLRIAIYIEGVDVYVDNHGPTSGASPKKGEAKTEGRQYDTGKPVTVASAQKAVTVLTTSQ